MADLNLGDTRLILSECQRQGLLRNQAAYVLATAFWETAQTMEPVREAFWLSESWRSSNLRYYPWYGRGFVQITWEANYERMGKRLGLDLTSDPDVVMREDVAVQILIVGMVEGLFTGQRLSDYITLNKSNYRGARRIVNGTDKANPIAELAREYEADLKSIGYGVEESPPVTNERRDGTQPRDTPAKSTTLQAAFLAALATLGQVMDTAKGLVGQISEQFGVSPEVALGLVAFFALAYISRERWLKWIGGVR